MKRKSKKKTDDKLLTIIKFVFKKLREQEFGFYT